MKKTTSPPNSPLHGGRNRREKTLQCYNSACSPFVEGGVRGGEPSVVLCGWNSKSKIINLKSIGSVI